MEVDHSQRRKRRECRGEVSPTILTKNQCVIGDAASERVFHAAVRLELSMSRLVGDEES
jgi:hypothetical protein